MTDIFNYLSILLIFLSSIIIIYSLIYYSSILIKLVALEVLTNILLASIALIGLIKNQPMVIDFCVILSIIMFLGVVSYYQYLYHKEIENADSN